MALRPPTIPADPERGTRDIPFGRELWIERADFMEDPPRKFFRLARGREVRLRFAYLMTCTDVVRDADGRGRPSCAASSIRLRAAARRRTAARCAAQFTGSPRPTPSTPRSASTTGCSDAEIPGSGGRDWLDDLNPDSLTVVHEREAGTGAGRRRTGRDPAIRAHRLFRARSRTVFRAGAPPARSSTAPSPCATAGRSSRRGKGEPRLPDGRRIGRIFGSLQKMDFCSEPNASPHCEPIWRDIEKENGQAFTNQPAKRSSAFRNR